MIHLPDPSASRAVLVGVTDYADPARWDALPSVAANVSDLRAAFCDSGLWGLPKGNCEILLNPTDGGAVLQAVLEACSAADTVLFSFAGHGVAIETDLLLPLASTDSENLLIRSLRFSIIRDLLQHRRARHAVVLLDSCFSGVAHSMADVGALVDSQVAATSAYTLTSSARDSISLAPPGERHTAFTGELLRILTTGLPSGPELLSLGDIQRAMTAALAVRKRPLPSHSQSGAGEQLALARNRLWNGRPPPAASTRPEPPVDARILRLLDGIPSEYVKRGPTLKPRLAAKARERLRIPLTEDLIAVSRGYSNFGLPGSIGKILLAFSDKSLYASDDSARFSCPYTEIHALALGLESRRAPGPQGGGGTDWFITLDHAGTRVRHGPWGERRARDILAVLTYITDLARPGPP